MQNGAKEYLPLTPIYTLLPLHYVFQEPQNVIAKRITITLCSSHKVAIVLR